MNGVVKRIRKVTLDGWFEKLTFENQRLKRKVERQRDTILRLKDQIKFDRDMVSWANQKREQKLAQATEASRLNQERCDYLSRRIVELKQEIGELKAVNAVKET